MPKRLFLAFAVLGAASCGDKSKPSTVPPTDLEPPPIAKNEPSTSTATAPATSNDAGAVAQPALPARTCMPAHAATIGWCNDGLRCLLLFAIDDKCVVSLANAIDIPDEASTSDGAGIGDIAWPTKDGSIFLVNKTDPTWSWTAVASPLTAKHDVLATAKWTRAKVGQSEPEGFQYGLATDGARAYLAGCKKWTDDCSPDAEECEEWYCKTPVFIDPLTKKKLAKPPAVPFVGGAKTGAVTDAITLGKKAKEQTCAAAGAAPDTFYGDPLDGSIALSPTDWLAMRYDNGSRMDAKWGVRATYMRGCDYLSDVNGTIVVGPNQLWARSTDDGWELQHGPLGAPLTDATGKIKAFGDSFFLFTSE